MDTINEIEDMIRSRLKYKSDNRENQPKKTMVHVNLIIISLILIDGKIFVEIPRSAKNKIARFYFEGNSSVGKIDAIKIYIKNLYSKKNIEIKSMCFVRYHKNILIILQIFSTYFLFSKISKH
uniref:LAGLIDADG_2 domain-containing protein n=1 Tax=Strongyloides venezuelensis TaxID=75913 RepID=A0A0K0FI57_STRVS